MTTIAFVLLTYAPDAPAGIERSIAALSAGLRQLGHRTLILTAADAPPSAETPDLVRLATIGLPTPAVEADLMAALAEPGRVEEEIRNILTSEGVDVACWVDTAWGLGYLAPAPTGVRTALMVRVLRTDPLFVQALANRPNVVLTNSQFMIDQAAVAGVDTHSWVAIPNALLITGTPPDTSRREALRRHGPVRIAVRAEPHKGIVELIDAIPADFDRPVEIALAVAGFEYWPGMQDDVITRCRRAAVESRAQVRIQPALLWRDVPGFLGGACVTIIASTSPESFCNTAAEALSVGTPVVAFDHGHVPVLTGPAGVMVALSAGPESLWHAAQVLLSDVDAYHQAARAAPLRVERNSPPVAAAAFLAAVVDNGHTP